MEKKEIIYKIINKKYDYLDAYVIYQGVTNLIINELIEKLNQKIISEKDIIENLINFDEPELLLSFCEFVKEIDENLFKKVVSYLKINEYYTLLIRFCNVLNNAPKGEVFNYVLSTENFQLICDFVCLIKNIEMKNKGIDYILKNGNLAHMEYLLKNLDIPLYSKILKKMKTLSNGINVILRLSLKDNPCQEFALNEILNTNNEKLIKELYNNIDVYTQYYKPRLIEKIELKIKELEKNYNVKLNNTLLEKINIELNQEKIKELSELPLEVQIVNLQECLKNLQELVNPRIDNKSFVEIINKYYNINFKDINMLYSFILGTTRIKKETQIMNSNCFFTKSIRKIGTIEKCEKTGGIALRRAIFPISYGENFDVIVTDPIIQYEPYHYKLRHDLYVYYKNEVYQVLITYYYIEKFGYPKVNLKNLTISEIKRLIETRKILVTNIEYGKCIGEFNSDDLYENKILNDFNEMKLDLSNISVNYANTIAPLLKGHIKKESIEKDINYIINYLRSINVFDYKFMIANYLNDDINYERVNKILRKSIK